LMWPTDILYAYVGFFLLIKSQHPSGDSKYAIFLQRYTVLHMVAAVMMIFIGGFNILPQNVDRVLVWLVPLMLFTTSTAAFPDKIFRKTA